MPQSSDFNILSNIFVYNGAQMHICTDVLRGFRMLIISAHRWCHCCFLPFCSHFWVVGVSTPVLISPKKASITGTLTRIPFLIIVVRLSTEGSRGFLHRADPAANVVSEVKMCKCWMIKVPADTLQGKAAGQRFNAASLQILNSYRHTLKSGSNSHI